MKTPLQDKITLTSVIQDSKICFLPTAYIYLSLQVQ